MSGIATPSREALSRQAGLLNIHTRYLHETIAAYAERLTTTFAAPLSPP
jgi:hypothetical protein